MAPGFAFLLLTLLWFAISALALFFGAKAYVWALLVAGATTKLPKFVLSLVLYLAFALAAV
ncbi:MAG: hypothetical protein O9972_43415, partial [Burkholderiales bacterium]|nr:hypothetical protein [Burkholderiales bacterium]